jgi:hypothetical protein
MKPRSMTMGSDMYGHVEFRQVVGYNRSDAVVQGMRREEEDLTPIAIHSEWMLGAFEAGREERGDGHYYETEYGKDWVYDESKRMFSCDRNYLLFAWLTGGEMRGYALERFPGATPLLDYPRGVPEGTVKGHEKDWGIRASWVHVAELEAARPVIEKHFHYWLPALDSWRGMDARLVFTFDC